MAENPYQIHIGRQAFSEIIKTFIGFIGFFVGFIIIFIFTPISSFASFIILPFIGFFVLIFVIVLVYNLLYLNAISYSVSNTEFNLKGGIIARFEKILPYSKIQHSIITRSFMQRIFGLSTVVIQTAGHDTSFNYNTRGNQDPYARSPRIPGLDVNDAEKLRSYIIAQVLRTKSGQGI
ncbi:MAG: PH domain-containing protein [Candidatus Pacearchaeota archaeon]